MKPTPATSLSALLILFVLSSCAHYATIDEKPPTFRPLKSAIASLGTVEKGIMDGLRVSKRDPMKALADYLLAIEAASQQLARTPNDLVVRDDYNFAVARMMSVIQQAKLDPWSKPLTVPANGGDFVLTRKADARAEWNPALYEFKPADQFDVGGVFIKERNQKPGIGAPMVAIGRQENVNARAEFKLPRTFYGVTAIVRVTGKRCEIGFEDPLATEEVQMAKHTFPLAADFTVPLAVMLASTDVEKMALSRLLNPEKYAHTARIARLQPYDPDKTVVLVVHGLNSTPATWTPMINALRDNEQIRKHFQFWFYSYPSGYPYPQSAAILRKELDAIQKKFPLRKKMVVIGHSMGGCISRLLITDVGDKLWEKQFGAPINDVKMSPGVKQLFTDALVFHERPDVGRVIFIAAPLKGADMASGWLGRLGARFVKAPLAFAQAGTEMLKVLTFHEGELKLNRIPNSVDTLAPNNRFVRQINTFPLSTKVPYHSIIGDRGKGGNKHTTKPISSDGLVPYWSSHLDGAKSELVVPSGHSAHLDPQAIDEVKRILLLHANAR